MLRGRGGTEVAAALGHSSGAPVTFLDDRLQPLESAALAGADQLAAIGPADSVPAYAAIENRGVTQKPLTPVHPRSSIDSEGSLCLSWTRRARGAWAWIDEVEVPLVEEAERYRIGLGSPTAPLLQWDTSEPLLIIVSSQLASLQASHVGEPLWVRQVGSHQQSDPLFLAVIS